MPSSRHSKRFLLLLLGSVSAFSAVPRVVHRSAGLIPTLPARAPPATMLSGSALLVAQRVCPALGFVLSSALYCAPVPTLREAIKQGSLGAFNPLPSALMVTATTAWLGYGLSVRDPWIALTNAPGALVALAQLVVILPLMKPGKQLQQFQATVLGGAAFTIALWGKLIFGGASAAARSKALGLYATIICIALFASPLATIASVVREKNSESILASLTAAQVANCVLWTTYGVLAARDPFVWGPNGVGLVLGLIQLALKVCFPAKK
jgi:solute carrier family 50 protein (sugar transporter)